MAGAVTRHAQPSLPRATMGKPDGSALDPAEGTGARGRRGPVRWAMCHRLGKGAARSSASGRKLGAGMGLPLPGSVEIGDVVQHRKP